MATQRLRGSLKAIDDFLAPVSRIVIFVTILLGGYQYFQAQQDKRVERTLAYIDAWNDDGLRDVYEQLNLAVWPLYSRDAQSIEALVKTGADRQTLLSNIGLKVTDQSTGIAPGADLHVDRLFEFFDRVALCSNERLCDFQVFDTFLGSEVRSFWLYFAGYADLRTHSGYVNYGRWTQRLAEGEIAQRAFLGVF